MDPQNILHVQDTNQQALSTKISAIRKGYIQDPFAEEFAPFKGNRDIIMHRGYWARVYLVRKLVQKFIRSSVGTFKQYLDSPVVQIISLGCGLETLWFNLINDQNFNKRNVKFVQLDLHSVVKRKITKIQKSQKIKELVTRLGYQDTHLLSCTSKIIIEDKSYLNYGEKYMLRACDLSDLTNFKNVIEQLKLDVNVPTLFYCECVLSYIEPEPVDQLIKFIHDKFRLCWIFDYEMYNPLDRFGKMMVQNFDSRGCHLAGVHKYPNLLDQRTRFESAGFKADNIQLDSMDKIYYNYIDKNQRLKIEKIEMLDELQEWNIIMNHYFGLLAHNCLDSNLTNSEQQMIKIVKMKEQ